METIYYRGKQFTLTDKDLNSNIKCHLLDDNLMKKAGFTDIISTDWYWSKILSPLDELSFNIRINKKDPQSFDIDILDDDFCQPFDYQSMIQRELDGEEFAGDFHWQVNDMVECIMEHLTRLGIISGWQKGDYI